MDALIADIAGAGRPMANLEVKVFGGADLYRLPAISRG
jgi:chemotaxis receptor (MCP) glutamine deamidase CheD